MKRRYQIAAKEGISTVFNCQAKREFWQRAQYPPGFLGKIEPGCMAYNHKRRSSSVVVPLAMRFFVWLLVAQRHYGINRRGPQSR